MRTIGWIALDIDGTITNNKFSVPSKVNIYLKTLAKHSWKIIFTTGRSFSFSQKALSEIDFPYTICAQNGSVAIQMQEGKIIHKDYILGSNLKHIEDAYDGFESDFLVYSGVEKGDFCYWRPQKFNDEQLAYLEDLKSRQTEDWHTVDEFDPIHVIESPLVKCFGKKDMLIKIQDRLEKLNIFETCMIKDPFDEEYHLLQVTAKGVSKGNCIAHLRDKIEPSAYIIAAGDDYNDLSLLNVANEKIVMPTAPADLKDIATILAPPVEELGIIDALDIAIANMSK